MGINYISCGSCKKITPSDYTCSIDESIQIIHEILQKEEVKNYLFEIMKLNKEDTLKKVDFFLNICHHSFCDYCIKEDDIRNFHKIDEYYEVNEVDFKKEQILKDIYNYILALMKVECNECNSKKRKNEINTNLDEIINNIKDFLQQEIKLTVKKVYLKKTFDRFEEIIKKIEALKI